MKTRYDLPEFLNKNNLLGYGAEIGVLKGEYSTYLLDRWKGQRLFLIDSWRHIDGKIDLNNTEMNDQCNNITKTCRAIYKYNERAVIIRGYSVQAADLFLANYFDFVFLDASHSLENVAEDLNCWWPKIKKDGVLVGHDYTDGLWSYSGHEVLFGVKSAVDSFAKAKNLKVNLTEIESDSFFPSYYILK